jgi:hypothetical protein
LTGFPDQVADGEEHRVALRRLCLVPVVSYEMTQSEPRTPTSAAVGQPRITEHQQRRQERRHAAALRYLAHRVRSLAKQVESAGAEQRTNDE